MPYLVKTDGSKHEYMPANGKKFTGDEMRQIVGGYYEFVYPRQTPAVVFVCNELGHIEGLPVNVHGSALYGRPGSIVGDILVLTRAEFNQYIN